MKVRTDLVLVLAKGSCARPPIKKAVQERNEDGRVAKYREERESRIALRFLQIYYIETFEYVLRKGREREKKVKNNR